MRQFLLAFAMAGTLATTAVQVQEAIITRLMAALKTPLLLLKARSLIVD